MKRKAKRKFPLGFFKSEEMILYRIYCTLQVSSKVGFAGVVATNHVDQMVIHDATVKPDLVQGLQDVDEVVITRIGECFIEAAFC